MFFGFTAGSVFFSTPLYLLHCCGLTAVGTGGGAYSLLFNFIAWRLSFVDLGVVDVCLRLLDKRVAYNRRYYPASRKKSKARRATLVIMSMILIVVSCIGGVYAFRYGAWRPCGRRSVSLRPTLWWYSCIGSKATTMLMDGAQKMINHSLYRLLRMQEVNHR